jgi:hypothetical protein
MVLPKKLFRLYIFSIYNYNDSGMAETNILDIIINLVYFKKNRNIFFNIKIVILNQTNK